jgi:translocation and assembly module TamA
VGSHDLNDLMIRRVGALALVLLCATAQAAPVQIEVKGLSDDLAAAARASIDLQKFAGRSMPPTQVRRLFDRADDQIIEAMQPYGYYHARVKSDLKQGEKPDEYIATFEVELGEPVLIRESTVRVQGDAAELPEVQNALAQFEPKVGGVLDHGAYENSKAMVSTELQAQGYFDADLARHRIEVVQSANAANIDVEWVSNRRYRFGEINFSDAQFPETFLQRYVPWKEGDYYSTQQLLTLQQRLVDADYFSAVSVQPDLERASDDSMPIEVLLLRAKRTVYTADAYVSTDTGPGIRLGADRRWLNKRGHKLGAEIEYSQRLQEISTNYRIPKPGPRNRNYNFGAGYRDEETDTSRSRMARLVASEVLDEWHNFTRTLGLQYLNGNFEIADRRHSTNLLFAEGMLTRKRADDLMFPTRGLSLLYGVRLAAEQLLSDTSLAQIRAEAKWIRPVATKGRLITRAAAGAMIVDNFDALPPELRFFAGGDRSVRGFDYQSIGETDEQGGVIGGEYLTVVSTEYEHYFLENWGAAVFVDAGDAYSSELDANVGAGVGVRWRSPVGLVRLDVAVPVVSDLDEGVRLHIVIGPDL